MTKIPAKISPKTTQGRKNKYKGEASTCALCGGPESPYGRCRCSGVTKVIRCTECRERITPYETSKISIFFSLYFHSCCLRKTLIGICKMCEKIITPFDNEEMRFAGGHQSCASIEGPGKCVVCKERITPYSKTSRGYLCSPGCAENYANPKGI